VSPLPASNRIRPASFLGHLSDEALVLQAKLGSEHAFIELWSRHGERVRILVWRIIRHREDVEDVLQEVYLKSFTRLGSFNGDALFSTWLSRIGINLALMLLRKRRNRPEVFIESADSDSPLSIMEAPDRQESIELSYFRAERIQTLRQAIQRLPPQLRNVVELQNRDELPLREIARITGLSLPAVKARLVRARRALRKLTSHGCSRKPLQRRRRESSRLPHSAPSIR
jgi:RNA polymerase sigma factor (sigma-70 family)